MTVPIPIIEATQSLLKPYGVDLKSLLSNDNDRKYMSTKQASRYSGLAEKTIRMRGLAGDFETRRMGRSPRGKVLVVKNSFDAWLDSFAKK